MCILPSSTAQELASLLTHVQGRLDLYYVVLIIMSVLNVFYFLIVSHFYKYKQVKPALASV